MIKAALAILVEEEEPAAILYRLDRLLRRSGQEGPGFVTATLTFLDVAAGAPDRQRRSSADLPAARRLGAGNPAAGLAVGGPRQHYGSTEVDLAPGDALVWLSDGFIEATDPDGEVFGYDRTVTSLGARAPVQRSCAIGCSRSVARYTEEGLPRTIARWW